MRFVDANVFIYAAGRQSPHKAASVALLEKIFAAPDAYCTSTEVLQELLHRYRRVQADDIGFRLFDALYSSGIKILSVTPDAMRHARLLLADMSDLSTRDAVHIGTMRAHSLVEIVTFDKAFDRVTQLRRIQPTMP